MAEEGAVIACHNVEAWNQQLQQANECKKLNYAAPSSGYIVWSPQLDKMVHVLAFKVVVDFTASWCGPCRAIAPFFQELAKKFTDVIFLKVDVDELTSVAKDWAIEAMPTFIFLKDGSIVDKLVGALKDELPKKIELLMAK